MQQLAAELERLVSGAASATPALPPITPQATVDGFRTHLSWDYDLTGDYDLNYEVNASDLSYLGRYFGQTASGSLWEAAQWADGNKDGAVNLDDVATIAAQFKLKGRYAVEYSFRPDGPWVWYDPRPALAPWPTEFSRQFTDSVYAVAPYWRVVHRTPDLIAPPQMEHRNSPDHGPEVNSFGWAENDAEYYEIFRDNFDSVYATLPANSDYFTDPQTVPFVPYAYYLRGYYQGRPSELFRLADSIATIAATRSFTASEVLPAQRGPTFMLLDDRWYLAQIDATTGALSLTYSRSQDPANPGDWRTVEVGVRAAEWIPGIPESDQLALVAVAGRPAVLYRGVGDEPGNTGLFLATTPLAEPYGPMAFGEFHLASEFADVQVETIDNSVVVASSAWMEGLEVKTLIGFYDNAQWDRTYFDPRGQRPVLAAVDGRPAVYYEQLPEFLGGEDKLLLAWARLAQPQDQEDWQVFDITSTGFYRGSSSELVHLSDHNGLPQLLGRNRQGLVLMRSIVSPALPWHQSVIFSQAGDYSNLYMDGERLACTFYYRGPIFAWREHDDTRWQYSWIESFNTLPELLDLNGQPGLVASYAGDSDYTYPLVVRPDGW